MLGVEVKTGGDFDLGQEVVVVGGGNVAINAAMTALRLSGSKVRLFCLESREEMPAHAQEIAKAEAERVEINTGWGPARIDGADGQANRVEFRRCVSVFDPEGRFAPTYDEQETTSAGATAVILAVGQAPPKNTPTEGNGMFLAGDILGGSTDGGSVVHAVASGRAAAERIDRHLGGDGNVTVRLVDSTAPAAWIGRDEGVFAPRARVPVPCEAPEARKGDFRPIEASYTADRAVAEAKRCLQCDLRLLIAESARPPEKWLEFSSAVVESVPEVEGVFILADAEKKLTMIKGADNIRGVLAEKLDSPGEARFFMWEEDRMFTKRESELIQQHLSQYGELPGGGDDELDDLF